MSISHPGTRPNGHRHGAWLPPGALAVACLLLPALFGGCAGEATRPASRMPAAALADAAGWQRLALPASPFVLIAWVPPAGPVPHLTVYLEGDGQAWITRTRASDDPTPRDPVALRLALAQPGPGAAYLARPCQYVAAFERAGCAPAFWTARRFAPEVVAATNGAIDLLKARFGATTLSLAGYSGGAALAALAAARRDDVRLLVTVAGNLDHALWTSERALSPLDGSLNAADAWRELAGIPQVHFVGAEDTDVSPAVQASYNARFPPGSPVRLETVSGFDHRCCWVERWPELLASAERAADGP